MSALQIALPHCVGQSFVGRQALLAGSSQCTIPRQGVRLCLYPCKGPGSLRRRWFEVNSLQSCRRRVRKNSRAVTTLQVRNSSGEVHNSQGFHGGLKSAFFKGEGDVLSANIEAARKQDLEAGSSGIWNASVEGDRPVEDCYGDAEVKGNARALSSSVGEVSQVRPLAEAELASTQGADGKQAGRNKAEVQVEEPGDAKSSLFKAVYTVQRKNGGRYRAGRHAASVALQVDRFKLNQDIEKLSRKESRLLPEALLEALDDRIRVGEWQKALKIFELLRRQAWYEPQRAQYLRLLKLLAEHKQCYCASELWHAMDEDQLPPSVETCTALLNTYVKSRRLDEAFEVFELMKSTTDCHPDVYTYTILIEALLQENELDRVVQLRNEMEKNGIEQNTATLNILLESFGKTGNLRLMEATFKDMCSNSATRPDSYTRNIILKSFGKLGRIKEMEEWYSRMQKMEAVPDAITFNIMIHAYGRKRDFMKMRNVAHQMRSLYFSWNDVTFNTMIEAYGKAGMISEMEEIYRIMKVKGIKPSAFTLTILFNAYSKEEMWEKVEKIRREWRNSDLRADVVMYNSLLEAYRRWGNIRMLEETFHELEETLGPDRASYDILTNAYRSFGMREKYDEAVANSKRF